MKIKPIFAIFTFFLTGLVLNSCLKAQKQESENKDGDHKFTNELVNQSSPYLLQHAHNPVNWYPWGEEAIEKAKKEDKLLIISIGYAACHWCHVMERESFEDEEVAKFMNDNFVAIKVDREERPDVDQIYMDASYLINQSGGWPLNAIALPDGKPVFAGTYFPKDKWMKVLEVFSKGYTEKRDELVKQAENITAGVQEYAYINVKSEEHNVTKEDLEQLYFWWKGNIDFKYGGKTGAPKFPMPNNYNFLLNYYKVVGEEKALEAVKATLDNMAFGGIYDHLGGGFARYSTDTRWKVPHFEKMLYDNGQLVSLYSKAYQLTKDPKYKKVVYETIEFVERELTSPENGFYSSLDADSEGEEGKFYIWKKSEIDSILGKSASEFNEFYNVSENGNWEDGNNILLISPDKAENNPETESIRKSKAILFKERSKRERPGLDDKILTSWNALMLKGYVDAYKVFGEERFLKKALQNSGFILKNMKDGNRLDRNYKNGESSINGFLDDYSLTIDAFIALYQATFDEKWLDIAKSFNDYAIEHFYDEKSGMFFYTSDLDPGLIARKMEIADNVIVSSNSSMANNLFVLGTYFDIQDYKDKSNQMLSNVFKDLVDNGMHYANWGILLLNNYKEPYEVAIVGDDFEEKRKEFEQHYFPNILLMGGKTEGNLPLLENKLMEDQTTIYVCKQKVCKLPVLEVKKAITLIK